MGGENISSDLRRFEQMKYSENKIMEHELQNKDKNKGVRENQYNDENK